jgi:hypothetical protein
MLSLVSSAGVNWWGFAVGDAWVLSGLVGLLGLSAAGYLIREWVLQRGAA